MKNIFLSLTLLFVLQCSFAQVTYYKGEWTKAKNQDLFTGIFKITMNSAGKAKAQIIWTYRAIDSTNIDLVEMYKNKKGKSGIEYVKGFFSANTHNFYFEGVKKYDPYTILGLEKYHLKLAANKQVIYGTTETEGTNEGLLYAVKLNYATGKKMFTSAKAKIRK